MRTDAGAIVADGYFDTVPKVLGRRQQAWFVIATIRSRPALGRCVKAIGNQIEQDPCDVLWEDISCTGGRIK